MSRRDGSKAEENAGFSLHFRFFLVAGYVGEAAEGWPPLTPRARRSPWGCGARGPLSWQSIMYVCSAPEPMRWRRATPPSPLSQAVLAARNAAQGLADCGLVELQGDLGSCCCWAAASASTQKQMASLNILAEGTAVGVAAASGEC